MHQQRDQAESLWHQGQLFFANDISQLARLVESGTPDRTELIAALRAIPMHRWRYATTEEGAIVSRSLEAATDAPGTFNYHIVLRTREDFCLPHDAAGRLNAYGSICYQFGSSSRELELTPLPTVVYPTFDALKAALGDPSHYERLELPLAERAQRNAERYALFTSQLAAARKAALVNVTKERTIEELARSRVAIADRRSDYGSYEETEVSRAVTCELDSGQLTAISVRYMFVDHHRNRDPYATFILSYTDRTTGHEYVFCELDDRVLPEIERGTREILGRK